MNTTAVTLTEWRTLYPEPGSPLHSFTFGADKTTRDLGGLLTANDRLIVRELATGLEIQATSYVGRIQLGNLSVTIRPKLPGAPMMRLLRYVYDLRDLHLLEPSVHGTEAGTFQDLLIRQLVAEISELLVRGIHRDYERRAGQLASPRGRINFDLVAKSRHLSCATLPCVHHPRLEDNLLNQLLLSGLAHAMGMTACPVLKAHSRRLCQQLAKDVATRHLDRKLYSDAQARIDRRTRSYEPAIRIIGMLMRGEGLSLEDPEETLRMPGFLFDMNRFFQALVSRFLHDHLAGWEVVDEFKLRHFFIYDPARNPRGRRNPGQRPDFVIRKNRRVVAVLDAKYRDLWETALPREMLYQLSLYALGVHTPERRAVILYPTLDPLAKDQAILIRAPFEAAQQAEVVLRPVNLLLLDEALRDSSAKGRLARESMANEFAFGPLC